MNYGINPSLRKKVMNQTARQLLNASIDDVATAVHQNAIEHGFHDPAQARGDFLAHMICNTHAELSELYDAWRAGKLDEPCDKAGKMIELNLPPLSCAEEEYADIVIRALDQARRLKIDIARAIAVKHAYNTTRPYKHGKLS